MNMGKKNIDVTPLVSIVSVFYNREKFVDESVQSLLGQTYENVEIILVDDGSTDRTLEFLANYQGDNVKIISHQNKGFTKSIKEAMSLAHGEFIAIHGSGDISYPERISKQVELLLNDASALMCGVKNCNIDFLTKDIVDYQVFPRKKIYVKDFLRATPFTHGAVMYRAAIYNHYGGYDDRLKYTQDWDLWLRILRSGGYALYLDELLYARVNFPEGASNSGEKAISQLIHGKIVHFLFQNPDADRDEILSQDLLSVASFLNSELACELKKGLSRRALRLKINDLQSEYDYLKRYLSDNYGGLTFVDQFFISIFSFMNMMGVSNKSISKITRFALNGIRYIG